MIDRSDIRDELVAALHAHLVADLGVASTVVGHRLHDPAGTSPTICVLAESAERPVMTARGNRSVFGFILETWTRLTGSGMTAAEAEDVRDLLERRIAEWVEANRGADQRSWASLAFREPSLVQDVEWDGVVWLTEQLFVSVAVHG